MKIVIVGCGNVGRSLAEQLSREGHNITVVDEIEDEEEEALILKEVSNENAEEAFYDIVDDEKELSAVAAIFEELLDDLELVTQE